MLIIRYRGLLVLGHRVYCSSEFEELTLWLVDVFLRLLDDFCVMNMYFSTLFVYCKFVLEFVYTSNLFSGTCT